MAAKDQNFDLKMHINTNYMTVCVYACVYVLAHGCVCVHACVCTCVRSFEYVYSIRNLTASSDHVY
jgi:hypothetical protein